MKRVILQLQQLWDIHLANTLRKLAHAIYRDFLALKTEKIQLKIFDIFAEAVLTSTLYTQSMFWSKNKKNRYTPAYLSFAI